MMFLGDEKIYLSLVVTVQNVFDFLLGGKEKGRMKLVKTKKMVK